MKRNFLKRAGALVLASVLALTGVQIPEIQADAAGNTVIGDTAENPATLTFGNNFAKVEDGSVENAFTGSITVPSGEENNSKLNKNAADGLVIVFKYKCTEIPTGKILCKDINGGGDNQDYGLEYTSNNKIILYAHSKDGSSSAWPQFSYPLTENWANNWHEFVICFTADNMHLFVDGNEATNDRTNVTNKKLYSWSDTALKINPTDNANVSFADFKMYTGPSLAEGNMSTYEAVTSSVGTLTPFFHIGEVEIPYTATAAYADGSNDVMGTLDVVMGTDSATFTATANDGYRFVKWTDADGNLVSRDAHITRPLEGDITYYATFKAAVEGTVNVAADVTAITTNGTVSNDFPLTKITDGNTDTGNYGDIGPSADGTAYIQIDLGYNYENIDYLKLWRYRTGDRTYNGTVIAVSADEDFTADDVVYNSVRESDSSKFGFGVGTEAVYQENTEAANGREIVLPPNTSGRFVRIYMQGSSANPSNHICELEVYAQQNRTVSVSAVAEANGTVSITSGGETVASGSIVTYGSEVTFTATSSDVSRYIFSGWKNDADEVVSESATYTIAHLTENTSLTAVFREYNLNAEVDYWNWQKATGNLSVQDDNDIWYYQVKSSERGWENIPDGLFMPNTYDGVGSWIGDPYTSRDGYYWGRITREAVTPCFGDQPYDAIAYAWKASQPGYVKMTLAKDPSSNNRPNDPALDVTIAKYSGDTEEILKTVTVPSGGHPVNKNNFTSDIAKVEPGDFIRFSVAKVNNDLLNVEPIIEECTVKDYAIQYVGDVRTIENRESYTPVSLETFDRAVENMDAALTTEDFDAITTALTALEEAVSGLTTKADKATLTAKIAEAESKIADSNYIEESKTELQNAIAAANIVKNNDNATTEEVAAAVAAIDAAIEALVLKGADYTALDAAIAEAEALKADENNYTTDSWTALTDALTVANGVARDLKITAQGTVDDAKNALNSAIDALILKGADYTALDAAIAEAEALKANEDNYTTDSWTALTTALEAANGVARDLKITAQGTVDDAKNALNSAIKALELKDADYTALDAAIASAEALKANENNYTPDSWTALTDALTVANGVARDLKITAQGTVDDAKNALNNAIDALILKGADYTALNAAIDAANALQADKYTESSWAVLTTELEAANGVDKNLDITAQKTVDDAATALNASIANLVRVYVVTVKDSANAEPVEVARGEYNTVVTITAPAAPEGMKFAGWEVNEKIVSIKENYTFAIANDIEFTATFVAAEQEVTQEPSAAISNTIIMKCADGKANVQYVAQLTVPEGYTLNQTGLLWSGKSPTNLPQLYGDNGAVNTGAKKFSVYKVNASYQFSVTVAGIPAGKTVRGVVYAKVTNNTTGKEMWIYSEEAWGRNK